MDDTDVYWINAGTLEDGGAVLKVPTTGGMPEVLATTSMATGGIRLDEASLYWLAFGDTPALMKVPKAGGNATRLTSDQDKPVTFTLHGGAIYWAAEDGSILTMSTDGTDVVTLHEAFSAPSHLVVHNGDLYWAEGSVLWKVPLTGGEQVAAATSPRGFTDPALNADYAYFGEECGAYNGSTPAGAIRRVRIDGGTPETLVSYQYCRAIAADSSWVYWADDEDDAIKRATLEGDEETVLASEQAQVGDMVIADGSVYWTAGSVPFTGLKGTVNRLDF